MKEKIEELEKKFNSVLNKIECDFNVDFYYFNELNELKKLIEEIKKEGE